MTPRSILTVFAFTVIAAGCASPWKSQSAAHATIYATTAEIPVLAADSTFIGAVDGVATDRGKGYVLVDPGTHTLTVFHVNCPLPIVVVFCLKSATKSEVTSTLEAGVAYRVDGLSRPPIPIPKN